MNSSVAAHSQRCGIDIIDPRIVSHAFDSHKEYESNGKSGLQLNESIIKNQSKKSAFHVDLVIFCIKTLEVFVTAQMESKQYFNETSESQRKNSYFFFFE